MPAGKPPPRTPARPPPEPATQPHPPSPRQSPSVRKPRAQGYRESRKKKVRSHGGEPARLGELHICLIHPSQQISVCCVGGLSSQPTRGSLRLGGLGQDHCGERGRWGLGKHGLHVASLLLPQLHGTCSQLSNAPLTIFSHHVLSEQSAFEPCGPFATVTPSRDPREAPRCLAPWTPR